MRLAREITYKFARLHGNGSSEKRSERTLFFSASERHEQCYGLFNSCSAELFVCGSFISKVSSQSASAQTFPRNSLHLTGFLLFIPNFGVWRQLPSAFVIFFASW